MGVRVLVVEDDPLVRRLVARMLGDGCSVRFASSVEQALAQLDQFEFDAVVADLELGERERDGLWVLNRVSRCQPSAKRLLMSGHHDTLREASATGCVTVLPKPFTGVDLLAAVGN